LWLTPRPTVEAKQMRDNGRSAAWAAIDQPLSRAPNKTYKSPKSKHILFE
jgi:hypothetical protein